MNSASEHGALMQAQFADGDTDGDKMKKPHPAENAMCIDCRNNAETWIML